MSSRSIAFIIPSFGSGGAERVVINLAAGIASRGERVRLVALDGRGPLRSQVADCIQVVDLGCGRARSAIPSLIMELRRDPPDVVLSSQTHLTILLAGIRVLLPARVTMIAREPLLALPSEIPRTERWLLPWALRRMNVVIATSEVMRARLDALMGAKGSVRRISNPVDVDGLRSLVMGSMRPAPARRESIEAIVVGRLVEQKGHADLLDALTDPAARSVDLLVVGDGPLRGDLERQANDLGLGDRVNFLGRIDDRANLASLIAGADVLVHPARYEGMPNAVLEALALGTPVIATTDLVMLRELASEVDSPALQLVPRASLGAALGDVTIRTDRRLGPDLLPARYQQSAVVDQILALLPDVAPA